MLNFLKYKEDKAMTKVIRTQNGEIINFANIIEISVMEGEAQDRKDGEISTVYAVIASDIQKKDRELAVYDTESEADDMLNLFAAWLSLSNEVLFDFSAETEEEEKVT